ncbi:unnamed protein product [Closterium sp. Yama58-4]|nr:unnamed protein product [Closterium sp. Yama58-4]
MVEFAAGYDKVDDITGGSLLLPLNDGWTNALAGYKINNPFATTSSDPVLEALSTVVSSSGSVSALNGMSANAKNALSRLAKFMSITQYVGPNDMQGGNYKNGRFSLTTALNQPIYLYGNVTGALTTGSGVDHIFTGTDRGAVDPTTYMKNGLIAGSGAGGPKAVSRVASAFALSSSTSVLGKITSSSDMSAIVVSDAVFPATMGSLTSSDPVQPYGKAHGSRPPSPSPPSRPPPARFHRRIRPPRPFPRRHDLLPALSPPLRPPPRPFPAVATSSPPFPRRRDILPALSPPSNLLPALSPPSRPHPRPFPAVATSSPPFPRRRDLLPALSPPSRPPPRPFPAVATSSPPFPRRRDLLPALSPPSRPPPRPFPAVATSSPPISHRRDLLPNHFQLPPPGAEDAPRLY